MKKFWFTPTMIGGLLAIYSVLYVWQPGGSGLLLFLTHTSWAAFALLAAILALKASRMFEPGMASRRVWLLMGAGMTVLTISELLWIIHHLAGQPLTYPSIVDISWGIGYIPVLASLVLQYRALKVQLSPSRQRSIWVIYLVVLLLIFTLSVNYVLSHPGEVAVMQMLVGAYYLIGNLGVAFLATLSLVFLGRALVARPWVYLVVGILLFAIAGLAFSYGTWTHTYATGSNFLSGLSDACYLAGYMLAAAGGYRQLTLHFYPAIKD